MDFKKREIKLFLLSGKARSGKDTVAKIINEYYGNESIIISFGHYIKDYVKRISNWDGNENTKPRDLLQQIGIELIKNKIDNKLFINRIKDDIEIFSYFYNVIIVDDVRLIDEIETLKSIYPKSISIRIISNEDSSNLTLEQKNHITETGLDNYSNFDYIIKNNKYIDLKDEVLKILKEV